MRDDNTELKAGDEILPGVFLSEEDIKDIRRAKSLLPPDEELRAMAIDPPQEWLDEVWEE